MAFDDDDNPTAVPANAPMNGDSGAAPEDGVEDGMPDYKAFISMFEKKGLSSKTIRRGEKDFESHGTNAQDSALESSRRAMEEVLGYTRIHRPDTWVRGWIFPDFWRDAPEELSQGDEWLQDRVVVVEHERGSWMKDIGRTVTGVKGQPGVGRLWLLPEEAIYLVERGTMDLWWPDRSFDELIPAGSTSTGQIRPGFGPGDYENGIPLSLEGAYSLLTGYEGELGRLSLPKYQVFAHLKRAGFHVLRAPPKQPPLEHPKSSGSLWNWLFSFVSWESEPRQKPFGPLVQPGLYRSYGPIYQQLALLPRHKSVPVPLEQPSPEEPFRIQFHVWRPGGAPFSKKSPPSPDFRIAVADTDSSNLPTLEQIDALLQSTPQDLPNEAWKGPGRMYQRLKHGHRNMLIAVVDRGLVNFMRFGEGVFGEEQLFERFDSRGGQRGGKKGGGGGRGRGRGRGRGGRGGGRGRGG